MSRHDRDRSDDLHSRRFGGGLEVATSESPRPAGESGAGELPIGERRGSPAVAPPEIGDRLGPFRLLRRIGEGGSSVVYSAVEESAGSTFALKLLLNPCDRGVDRLKRGFRALADLYHPNLVCLDRLHFAQLAGRGGAEATSSEGAGFWFITMEQVDGTDLGTFARQRMAEDHGASYQWLAELIRQIGAALSVLHARSLVHRDVKPSNFMIDTSGRLRLLDYGLIGSFEPWFGAAPVFSYLAGTLPYMAPEVLTHRVYPPASDIYSVGRVVLELLCGELPATDREVGENPRAWDLQNADWLPRELPEPLRELCASMLEFDPLDRPTAWDLERFECRVQGAVQLPAWVRDQPLPSIGREAEVATACRWIHGVIRGRGGGMHLNGPSGIGKTVLLREIVQAARAEWIEVFQARCRQREALPLRAFDEPINEIARRIAGGAWGPLGLSESERRAVSVLFPPLAPVLLSPASRSPDIPRTGDPLRAGDPGQRRYEAIEAAVRLFGLLSEETPILLVIDDLQWADADSLTLLRRLWTNPPPRLGILTAGRPEFAVQDLPLGERIEVGGVSSTSACSIICDRVRRRGLEISEDRARELCKDAAGNPYLLTYLGDLVGDLTGDLTGDLVGADETSQADFDALWALRRRRLSRSARLMLELLAVAGRPVDVSDLIAITAAAASDGDPPMEREEARTESASWSAPPRAPMYATVLAELRHESLIRDFGPDAAAVEMYHDRITEAVIRSAGGPAVRGHHRRWARWLSTQTGSIDRIESRAGLNAEIANHWIACEETAAALFHAICAADAARERLAFADAAHWYAWAADHAPVPAPDQAVEDVPQGAPAKTLRRSATALLRAAADCYATCGRSQRAAELYQRLAEADSGAGELWLRRLAAENYFRAGCLRAGRHTIFDVARRLRLPVRRSPAATKLTILWNLLQLRVLGPIDPAAEGRSPDPRQFARIDTELNLCRPMSLFDSLYTGSLMTAGMLHAARYGDRRRMLDASIAYAVVSSYDAGRGRDQAKRLVPAIVAAAKSLDDPKITADGVAAGGFVAWTQACWAEAVDPFLTAQQSYRTECSGRIFESVHVHWPVLWSFFYLGRLADLARTGEWIQQDAAERGDGLAGLTAIYGISAAGWLVRDRVDEFRSADRRLWANHRGLGFQLIHMFRLIGVTMRDCYTGHPASAWRRLKSLERHYRKSGLSRMQVVRLHWHWMHVHVAASLAAALTAENQLKDRQAWLRIAEKWRVRLRGERLAFPETLSQLAAGQIAELRGEIETARDAYRMTIDSAANQQLTLHRLAAEDRLAALDSGAPGTRLADHLIAQGVRNPAAFARLIAVPLDPHGHL